VGSLRAMAAMINSSATERVGEGLMGFFLCLSALRAVR